jgi:hypothetical protein
MAQLCHNQRKIASHFRHLHGYIFLAISGKRHQIQRPTVFARRKLGLAFVPDFEPGKNAKDP